MLVFRYSLVLLFLIFASWRPALAQDGDFSLEAYRAFLQAHADLSASGLQAMHAAGTFAETAPFAFKDALYSDSVMKHYALTGYERDLLSRHRFMVTERLQPNSFGDAFMAIYKRDLPVFVSADALLHALHRSYDEILKGAEYALLIPKLDALLTSMRAALPDLEARYAGIDEMDTALRDADVYLTVALSLLRGEAVAPLAASNAAAVADLLGYVEAEGVQRIPLFAETCRIVDFSQFRPRGHYDGEPRLEQYFRAMIWLGRTELYLTKPEADECSPAEADVQRQTVDAFLLREAIGEAGAEALYRDIESVLTLFVGEQDNVTIDHLDAVAGLAGVARASDLTQEGAWRAFQAELRAQPFAAQRILSQILMVSPSNPDGPKPASAFMLFGQRFVIDAYVTGSVVFGGVTGRPEYPKRMLPSTQDVLFALGNDASAQLLEPELERYGYAPDLAALRYLVDAYDETFWQETLYNGWLGAIRTLAPPAEGARSTLPPFMQTAAWWQKGMTTQLAAWAQLRHDNLLYAKQSYTGGITCEYPHSLVEPVPAFYEAVGRFAATAARRFGALEVAANDGPWVQDRLVNYFEHVEATADTLAVVAQKTLDGRAFTGAERQFLRNMLRIEEGGGCGGPPEVLDGWYPRLYYVEEHLREPDLVVADVHTAPTDEMGNSVGWVLHAGTGPLNMAVVTAEVPGADGPVAFVGPVLSYYEHLSEDFNRLTDEVWKEAYAEAPSFRPDFVNLYLAGADGGPRAGAVQKLATSLEEPRGERPTAAALTAPTIYPNPFATEAAIVFTVPAHLAGQPVEVTIYDARGRRIRHLLDQALGAGTYTWVWDGALATGAPAASGAYFCRVRVGDQATTGSMTLVR